MQRKRCVALYGYGLDSHCRSAVALRPHDRHAVNLPSPAVVLENAATMGNDDRDSISHQMGCHPHVLSASIIGPVRRRRFIWTNLRLSLYDTTVSAHAHALDADAAPLDCTLQQMLENPRHRCVADERVASRGVPAWLRKKGFCILSSHHTGIATGRHKRPHFEQAGKNRQNANFVVLNPMAAHADQWLRVLTIPEIENCFGLFRGYTRCHNSQRSKIVLETYKLLANAFSLPMICHVLHRFRFHCALSTYGMPDGIDRDCTVVRDHCMYPIRIKRRRGPYNGNAAHWKPGIDGLECNGLE